MIRRIVRGAMWLTGIAVAVIICCLAATPETKKEADTNPRAVQQDGFTMVGIAVRTSNAEQMTPERPIGKQWERLFKESVLAAIPNKADANIVALYTEYASDKDGEYTYVLGARVTKVESVPAGMVAKNVPAGRYALFTSERGAVQKVVVDMWQKVWATPKSALGGDRTYKSDYEVYDQRAQNPADAVVDLYVAVR
ncbi:MAG TPA: GyrI-like domain-containing protein [Verrucomicrobiae bacterium]|nr:GyrI-like domain-containing protein [Verrucomicrobiae bacterium]